VNIFKKQVSEIPAEYHKEILHLLQLGAGTVSAAGEVIIVREIAGGMYADKSIAKTTLIRILRGIQAAIRETTPKNPNVHISELMRIHSAEISKYLAELDA
jgi:hypothetical protein